MSPGKALTLAIGKLDAEVKTKLRPPFAGRLNASSVLVLDFSECEQNWPIAAFVLGFSPSCSRFWASKVDSEDDDEDEND